MFGRLRFTGVSLNSCEWALDRKITPFAIPLLGKILTAGILAKVAGNPPGFDGEVAVSACRFPDTWKRGYDV